LRRGLLSYTYSKLKPTEMPEMAGIIEYVTALRLPQSEYSSVCGLYK